MKILAIDTTGNDGYVALYERERLIRILPILENMHTCHLLEKIDQLLKDNEIDLDTIDYFAACIGPGSFTGTRIGVLTAKSLAFAKKKPVIGYKSFIGRSPPLVYIGKRKVAFANPDGSIQVKPADPTPANCPFGLQRTLDMTAIGHHIVNNIDQKLHENEKNLEIAYPEI